MTHQILLSMIALLSVTIRNSLGVVLTKNDEDIHIPIECSLNSDISFKFTNKRSNKTKTIAACSTTINSCYLSDKILAQSYAIAKSDVGGILFIIDVGEDTFGTYTCYETYNATNSAAVDVSAKDLQASTHSPTGKFPEENKSNFSGVVLQGIQIALLIGVFICITCIVCKVKCCTRSLNFCKRQPSFRADKGDLEKPTEAKNATNSGTESVEMTSTANCVELESPYFQEALNPEPFPLSYPNMLTSIKPSNNVGAGKEHFLSKTSTADLELIDTVPLKPSPYVSSHAATKPYPYHKQYEPLLFQGTKSLRSTYSYVEPAFKRNY